MITITTIDARLTLAVFPLVLLLGALFTFHRHYATHMKVPLVDVGPAPKIGVSIQHQTPRGRGSISSTHNGCGSTDDSDVTLNNLNTFVTLDDIDGKVAKVEDAQPVEDEVLPSRLPSPNPEENNLPSPDLDGRITDVEHDAQTQVVTQHACAAPVPPVGSLEANEVLSYAKSPEISVKPWLQALRIGIDRMKERCEVLRNEGENPCTILLLIDFVEEAMAEECRSAADYHMRHAYELYDLASKRIQRAPLAALNVQASTGPPPVPELRIRGAAKRLAENRDPLQPIQTAAGSSTQGRQVRSLESRLSDPVPSRRRHPPR